MQRRPIRRGGILSAGYDAERRTLDVEFDTRRVLRYFGVGPETADRFLTSAAPLSYYRDEIDEQYTCQELGSRALEDSPRPARAKGGIDALRKLFGEA